MSSAQEDRKSFVLDDFESEIVTGEAATVDVNKTDGVSAEVFADKENKHEGQQSLKFIFDTGVGGRVWIGRGYNLDAKGAARWLVEPGAIDWSSYAAISFYFHGTGSGGSIAFDVIDAGNEIFRFLFKDDQAGWRQIVCPFDQFLLENDQQRSAPDLNGVLDVPLRSFRFEPIAISRGEFNIDEVALEPLN